MPSFFTFSKKKWYRIGEVLAQQSNPFLLIDIVDLDAIEKKDAPVLVTFKNVKFPDADGTKAYAPEEELPSNSSITFIERDMQYSDGTKCAAVVHTSVFTVRELKELISIDRDAHEKAVKI